MRGYHFTGDTLRDGRPIPPIGEWLEHDGPVKPCNSGLHASEHPIDALQYAPGEMLHMVELDGDLKSHGNPVDKWCGRRRCILASIDATPILWAFARWCALQVIHLWDASDIVRRYLDTGDESLRDAASAAARAAASAAASAAARDAAWAAAWAAARDAAWAAARDAARDAASAEAWAAAWDAAWAAARDAARDAQRSKFLELVEVAFAER